jgi:hypothetical protein
MKQSPPWEANSHSASQEIPLLLLNPKVHHRVHKSPQSVTILSQMNPVHSFLPYLPNIHFNIIFPSTCRSSPWSLLFTFLDQNFVFISDLSHACYVPGLSHLPGIILIIFAYFHLLHKYIIHNISLCILYSGFPCVLHVQPTWTILHLDVVIIIIL